MPCNRRVELKLPPDLVPGGNPRPPSEFLAAYPHVGVMSEMIEGFAQALGPNEPLVRAPPNSLRTLDLGTRYSPEGACLPFKLLLGNLLQSVQDSKVNALGMVTERGPCRLGIYSLGMRVILADLGASSWWYDFNNADIRQGYVRFFQDFYRKTHGRSVSLAKIGRAFLVGFARLASVESLEHERNRLLAFETTPGTVQAAFESGCAAMRCAASLPGVWRALRQARRQIRSVPVDMSRDVVTVCISGEAFCVVDPFANSNVELRLARLRAVPLRLLWQTDYFRYALRLDHFAKFGKRRAIKAAAAYLPERLGGDANTNVGYALMAHRVGYDGMIHLKPFGCMMEFVAENVLQAVERDTGFPILSLTLDDMTGEERFSVRLEAFVDNLFRRRRQRRQEGCRP